MEFQVSFFRLRAFVEKCARSVKNARVHGEMRAFRKKYARSTKNARVQMKIRAFTEFPRRPTTSSPSISQNKKPILRADRFFAYSTI